MEKGNKEQMGEIENKQQDGRYKPNHINDYIKCNGLNIPIKRQRLSA